MYPLSKSFISDHLSLFASRLLNHHIPTRLKAYLFSSTATSALSECFLFLYYHYYFIILQQNSEWYKSIWWFWEKMSLKKKKKKDLDGNGPTLKFQAGRKWKGSFGNELLCQSLWFMTTTEVCPYGKWSFVKYTWTNDGTCWSLGKLLFSSKSTVIEGIFKYCSLACTSELTLVIHSGSQWWKYQRWTAG